MHRVPKVPNILGLKALKTHWGLRYKCEVQDLTRMENKTLQQGGSSTLVLLAQPKEGDIDASTCVFLKLSFCLAEESRELHYQFCSVYSQVSSWGT